MKNVKNKGRQDKLFNISEHESALKDAIEVEKRRLMFREEPLDYSDNYWLNDYSRSPRVVNWNGNTIRAATYLTVWSVPKSIPSFHDLVPSKTHPPELPFDVLSEIAFFCSNNSLHDLLSFGQVSHSWSRSSKPIEDQYFSPICAEFGIHQACGNSWKSLFLDAHNNDHWFKITFGSSPQSPIRFPFHTLYIQRTCFTKIQQVIQHLLQSHCDRKSVKPFEEFKFASLSSKQSGSHIYRLLEEEDTHMVLFQTSIDDILNGKCTCTYNKAIFSEDINEPFLPEHLGFEVTPLEKVETIDEYIYTVTSPKCNPKCHRCKTEDFSIEPEIGKWDSKYWRRNDFAVYIGTMDQPRVRVFNKQGFDQNGFDKNGFDCMGFDHQGFDRDGFDRQGVDQRGISRNGIIPPPHSKYSILMNL